MRSIISVFIIGICLSSGAMARDQVEVTQAMKQQATRAVLDVLKDPDSASFSDFKSYASNGKADVCGQVNSKNSYGGYSGRAWFVVPEGMRAMIYQNSAKGVNANNSIIKTLCKL